METARKILSHLFSREDETLEPTEFASVITNTRGGSSVLPEEEKEEIVRYERALAVLAQRVGCHTRKTIHSERQRDGVETELDASLEVMFNQPLKLLDAGAKLLSIATLLDDSGVMSEAKTQSGLDDSGIAAFRIRLKAGIEINIQDYDRRLKSKLLQ